MADSYLPTSKLFSTFCGTSIRRDWPQAETYGEARIGGDQGTPSIGNACAPAVAQQIATLSPTEMRILALVADGLSDKLMARQLCKSPGTVNTHLRRMFRKLGTHSRVSTVVKALRTGLLRLEDIAC